MAMPVGEEKPVLGNAEKGTFPAFPISNEQLVISNCGNFLIVQNIVKYILIELVSTKPARDFN